MISDLIFPESLRWHDDRLWFVDMYDGKVFRAEPDGSCNLILSKQTTFGGLGWLADGRLLVVDKPKRQILVCSGNKTDLYADLSHLGTSPLNEMLVCKDGTVLVGEYGFNQRAREAFAKGRVFQITPSMDIAAIEGQFAFPNGMVEQAGRQSVLIAESMAGRISIAKRTGDSLSVSGRLTKFPQGYPDGMCIDGVGRIWAALVGTKSIAATGSDGAALGHISFDKQPFDVCYAPNPDRLFVALSDADETDLAKEPIPRTGEIVMLAAERLQVIPQTRIPA